MLKLPLALIFTVLLISLAEALDPGIKDWTRARRKTNTNKSSVPLIYSSGYWLLENVTFGAATGLKLVLDTGSSQTLLFYGRNRSSNRGVNLHQNESGIIFTSTPDETGRVIFEADAYEDTVAINHLSVFKQSYYVQTDKTKITPQIPNYDGIMGFGGRDANKINRKEPYPWPESLCFESHIDVCRFGLATRVNKSAMAIFGSVNKSEFEGYLTEVPVLKTEWQVLGNFAVNNEVNESKTQLLFDYGTPGILGPIDVVREIFTKLGLQTSTRKVHYPSDKGPPAIVTFLRGYFACDKPPKFGFALSVNVRSNPGTIFNLQPEATIFRNNGKNNCTASLQGWDLPSNNFYWIVGQSFFQGLYVDHNYSNRTMGFARLKDTGANI